MVFNLIEASALERRSLVAVETTFGRFSIARVDEQFFLFADACPHGACPLSEGVFSGSTLMCDCHFSEFDIPTGRVLTEPAEEDLVVVEVSMQNGMLTIDEETLMTLGGA